VSHQPWSRVPLTAVCASADDIKCGPFGTQLNKDEFREEGVPLWGIKHVNVNFAIPTKEFLEPRTARRLQQYDLKPGDIVMTRKGTVGNCAVYPAQFEVGIMHSDLLRLRVDPVRCESAFLVHQLHHSPDVGRQLSLISGGAIMPGINVGRLKQLEIVLPPLAEQRRIAEVLDQAEALRANRRAALAQLDSLTQSLFLELFGDPARNSKNLPTISLGRLGNWASGGTPPRSRDHYFEGPIPWFSSGELNEMFVVKSEEHISNLALAETAAKRVASGALMLGMYDTAALKTSIAGVDCSCNQAIAFATIDATLAETLYVYFAIMIGREHFRRLQRGVRQKNLNLSMIRQIRIPQPELSLQREFARRVTAVEKLKTAHRASLAELDALFASLQHRAFRGEL
jgi:type I restriction enzyme, S subunit